jgi:hypothetical protein
LEKNMPASGKKEQMSEAELEQRSLAGQAHSTHGAYAFRDRGEDALVPNNRTRLAELREVVQNRQGVLELMQEKCADSILLFEIIQSHVAEEVKKGKSLDNIPSLKALPAFMNSMQRALRDLISLMPSNDGAIDADKVLQAVKHAKEKI